MKRLYHFLGSVAFAIILISLTALMVAVGTYLESTTESHQAAAEIIYQSLFFQLLLVGFFINIFISAIRRWPFRSKHIPFLITHLGLLMIISGALIKTVWGIQGNVLLVEGSSTTQIQLPDTMAVSINERQNAYRSILPLKKTFFGKYELDKNNLCTLIEFFPHSEQKIYSWIANNTAYLFGHAPFEALPWQTGNPLPLKNPLALVTDEKAAALNTILEEGLIVTVFNTQTGKKIGETLLKTLLQKEVLFGDWHLKASLIHHELEIHYKGERKKGIINIALTGPLALLNQHQGIVFLGKAPISIDLKSNIPLTLLQDSRKNTTLLTADEGGRIYLHEFEANKLPTYFAYNKGFDGYTTQAEFLGPDKSYSRKTLERKMKNELIAQVKEEKQLLDLSSIKIFQNASSACGLDFAHSFISFLEEWNNNGGWLYPENIALSSNAKNLFQAFNWSLLDPTELKSCLWLAHFFKDFDPALLNGKTFISLLKNSHWPLTASLEGIKDEEERLTLFSQQIYAMGDDLPWIPFSQEPEAIARVFTALLRVHGIHYSHISFPKIAFDTVLTSLESPLFRDHNPLPSLRKLEDNIPLIRLKINSGEEISLAFDRISSNFKWPSKDGRFLFQFHPLAIELPYAIRLHRAKQINYPESEQAFSYESELTFIDRRSRKESRYTISMNDVHETWDGYRFYLSGLSKTASGAHMVQLVVNRDPAKYWLTYPGGFLVALGIILLFWWKRRV